MKKKQFLWAGVCLLLVAALVLISARRSTPEFFFSQHREELQAAAEQVLAAGSAEGVAVEGVELIDFWPGPAPIIEFTTSGFGLAPSSHYEGIYYSPSDTPAPFQNTQDPLLESETGWSWTDGTDNHGSTTRIAPCWYTFEAHF